MPHRRKLTKNNDNRKKPALPLHPVAAIQQLIRISQSLMTLAERETQALLVNDMLAFSIMQYEKEKLSGEYVKASESFRNRLEEFRTTEPNLLSRLEKLQRDLSEKMAANNTIVERMRLNAEARAQKNVMNVMDPAFTKRIRMNRDNSTASTEGVKI